jgi:hypothetical protein
MIAVPFSEQAAERGIVGGERRPAGAKAHLDSIAFAARLKPCPFKTLSFSAACKVVP